MINLIKNFSISQKIMFTFTILFVFTALIVFGYLLPSFKKVMLIEKKSGIKYNVEIAYNLISEYNDRYLHGEFTLEVAQKRAKDRIKTMKYQDGKNYFWINDLSPRMIMHPVNSSLDGKDLSDYKDANGKRLFIEMKDIAEKNGDGFVLYYWKKVETNETSEKVSFVRLFKPWGWIIGTGIWINDLSPDLVRELDNIYLISYLISGSLFILIIILAYYLSNYITKRLKFLTSFSNQILNGKLDEAEKNYQSFIRQ